jgi:hypothetical protein
LAVNTAGRYMLVRQSIGPVMLILGVIPEANFTTVPPSIVVVPLRLTEFVT